LRRPGAPNLLPAAQGIIQTWTLIGELRGVVFAMIDGKIRPSLFVATYSARLVWIG